MVAFEDPSYEAGHHYLLVRENLDTGERAFHHVWWPRPATFAQLVHVAGSR
ncbi:hypothetical protein [Salininema proteolyticum]|uniref:Uncharacterized protein n=1 Tax=Salininema proteolyticum TaxID=1607685 RepID=A0ABV8TTT6_9ACTN